MKKKLKVFLKKCLPDAFWRWRFTIISFRAFIKANTYPHPRHFGHFGKNIDIRLPLNVVEDIESVYLHDNTRLVNTSTVVSTNRTLGDNTGKFILKKYSACRNVTVIAFNHRPFVGVPYVLTSTMGLDEANDIIIEEDAWIGINVTLLAGAHIGRGAMVAACSLVNKDVPPYAVVAGFPAKVVASKFSLEEILEHERILYSPEERFSKEFLEKLFEDHFQGKKSIGRSDLTEEQKERLNRLKKERDIPIYD
jgi:acetyltransferase-like isoleucine patch superfamily enzyme